jgi:hypothetical protein
MQLIHPDPAQGQLGLRAMRMVAAADGDVAPAARALLAAAQRVLLGREIPQPLEELEPVTPAELAAGFPTGALAEQLCQGMIVASLADGPATPAAWSRIAAFAEALRVKLPALQTMQRLMEHHMLLFRLDFLRHSHIADMVKHQYRDHGGLRGVAAGLLGMRGLHEEPALAARFVALGELPGDTLGCRFFHHCRDNGFSFPGEKFGFPLAGVYHDFAHVLGGYRATPGEEMLVGGLTAGFRRINPFYVLLFVQLTFGAGMNMTPVPQPVTTGVLAEPGLAERFLRSIERGAAMNTDLADDWDFWPLVALPIDEVRARIGLPPE